MFVLHSTRWYICMRCLGLSLCVFYFYNFRSVLPEVIFLYLISRQAETSRVR